MPPLGVAVAIPSLTPAVVWAVALQLTVKGVAIEMVNVVVAAHCPASGVNVYVVVAVLLIAGVQVPLIAGVLVEDVGSAAIFAPEQNGPTAANVGGIAELIVKEVEPTQPFGSV